jgi:hypothetical protein
MCEVINTEVPVSTDSSEKMKRMRTALKAIGGWVSYFMGICTLAFGFLTPAGTDMFIIIIGSVITVTGLVLLHQHVVQKNLSGKESLVKSIKYIGMLLFIPGLLGKWVSSSSSELASFFSPFLYTGLLIIVLSMVLKRAWGIKRVKGEK